MTIAYGRDRASLLFIPLSAAYLCAECRAVGNDARRCPACASAEGLLSLGRCLDRVVGRVEAVGVDKVGAVAGRIVE